MAKFEDATVGWGRAAPFLAPPRQSRLCGTAGSDRDRTVMALRQTWAALVRQLADFRTTCAMYDPRNMKIERDSAGLNQLAALQREDGVLFLHWGFMSENFHTRVRRFPHFVLMRCF